MTLPLNQGQTAAAEEFFEFLFTDEKEMKVSGPGGTGKTHLMSAMIDQIMPRYFKTCDLMGIKPQYQQVQMTATTNKAAEVLAISTQRPTSTIHSLLNLKPKEDYRTGATTLSKTENWKVHEDMILFIDEYTMVDTPLFSAIHEGTHNCKIVYVGDHCQLAPVLEAVSPVDRQAMRTVTLTEQMRTNVPELHAVNNQLRHTVETGEFLPIKIQPGIIDWLDDAQMEAQIGQTFLPQTHNSKLLAYTNGRVNDYNDHIRGVRQLPLHYTKNEPLISNTAIRIGKAQISVEEELEIIEMASSSSMIFIEAGVELEVCYCTLARKRGGYIEKVPVPVDRDHFLALIKYYQKQRNWPNYFMLKQGIPDLRPRDASTVHKSQGSTYDSVFIDLGNISTCHNPNQVARMLYVAFSRARNRVYLYGNLAEKYGGLVF